MAKRLTVYVVLHDGNYSGPAEDGTDTYRTRDKSRAERFAAGKTCYGSPATVMDQEVSIETARRWGLA
jgi:hypothetical protein